MTLVTEKKLSKRQPRLKKLPKQYGGHYTAIMDAGNCPHAYLNAAIPTTPKGEEIAPLRSAICEVCGHAYSHLIGSGTCRCNECRSDHAALHALAVQDECGVDLGWHGGDVVDRRDDLHIHYKR